MLYAGPYGLAGQASCSMDPGAGVSWVAVLTFSNRNSGTPAATLEGQEMDSSIRTYWARRNSERELSVPAWARDVAAEINNKLELGLSDQQFEWLARRINRAARHDANKRK